MQDPKINKGKRLAKLSRERAKEITDYVMGQIASPFSSTDLSNLSPQAKRVIKELNQDNTFNEARRRAASESALGSMISRLRSFGGVSGQGAPSTHPSMAKYEPNRGKSQPFKASVFGVPQGITDYIVNDMIGMGSGSVTGKSPKLPFRD